MGLAEEIQKLQRLVEQGAMTPQEFARAKDFLLTGKSKTDHPEPPPYRESSDQPLYRRLARVRRGAWLGGVCTGFAEVTSMPTWVWRLIFVFGALLYAFGLIAYIVLWLVLPESPE